MISAALLQLGRIILGYSFSSLITGYVVYLSMLLTGSSYSSETSLGSPFVGLFIAFMIVWFAACPAAFTVLLGEWRGWRMCWPYSISGSLIGFVLGSLFQPPAFFPWLGLGFGLVSGGIYWAIAGRRAGLAEAQANRIVMGVMGVIALATFIMTVPGLMGIGRY